jgi:hypothetical protein
MLRATKFVTKMGESQRLTIVFSTRGTLANVYTAGTTNGDVIVQLGPPPLERWRTREY